MVLHRRQQSKRREAVKAALAAHPNGDRPPGGFANANSSFSVNFVTFCKSQLPVLDSIVAQRFTLPASLFIAGYGAFPKLIDAVGVKRAESLFRSTGPANDDPGDGLS
jgi:hypothetical protein